MDHLRSPLPGGRTAAPYPFALGGQAFAALGVLADALAIIASVMALSATYHVIIYGSYGVAEHYLAMALLLSALYVPPRLVSGKYLVNTLLAEGRDVESMFYSWNYAFLALLVIGFLAKETQVFSRMAVVLIYIGGFGALLVVREAMFTLARTGFARGLLLGRPAMLLGTREALLRFHRAHRPAEMGLRIVEETVLPDDAPAGGGALAALRSRIRGAQARARALGVRDVFLLVPWGQERLLREITERFLELPVSVHLAPDALLGGFRDIRVERFGAMSTLEVVHPPLSPWARMAKRGLDVAGAALGLVLLAPLFAVVALAIRLESKGPVFFRQKRQGFNNRPFWIWKFRTMTVAESEGRVRQARRDDPRVTRVGRILRRLSIDELPQLINVLRGEMSLVGPRPHALDHDNHFERRVRLYARRHRVLPGITGWAQVNGYRGETDTEEKIMRRVELDLEYIDRWSIWFDLYIIVLTLLSPRVWRNAY